MIFSFVLSGYLIAILLNNSAFRQLCIYMGATLQEVLLRLIQCHSSMLYEPTNYHRRTSGTSRFAMDVDFPASQYFRLDKLNTFRDHLEGRRIEIGSREPKLFHADRFV
jgi:hypothetical protein